MHLWRGCVGKFRLVIQRTPNAGGIMSRHDETTKNKQSKHPKVAHQDYLYIERHENNELFANVAVSELEHRGGINDMRHAFKRRAKRIRAFYAAKERHAGLTDPQ